MGDDYSHLRADKLIETSERVASRVIGRFPDAGLGKVACTIAEVTRNAIERSEKIREPNWWLRGGLIALAVFVLLGATAVALQLSDQGTPLTRISEFLRLTAPGAAYLGAGIFFLVTLETKLKRGRAVQALHELRSLAHIIDMHQLSKDPDCAEGSVYDRQGMLKYLQFCSEMLALISKIGQLYVEDFPDGTTLAAVDQLESLTTGLSQKIWQKIMILERMGAAEEETTDTGPLESAS
jgi:hypothetical protein